jgi:hypothetical protein
MKGTPLLNFSGYLPPRAKIVEPRMNLSERVLVLIASALWNASNAAVQFSLRTDAWAELIESRAAQRINCVRQKQIIDWYAANPQPATVVITRPAVSMKRAQIVEAPE